MGCWAAWFPVSPQKVAGHQSVITRVIVLPLGGLRVSEARAGIVDDVLRNVADRGICAGVDAAMSLPEGSRCPS